MMDNMGNIASYKRRINFEYQEVIPEFNKDGRLCNHGSGDEEPVKVSAEEWERFNMLAGRQHRIEDGWVVYDETLEPCMPDEPDMTADETITQLEMLTVAVLELAAIIGGEK